MDTITLILFIAGFVLLVTGAETLVRGASRLALAVGISPLVIGLTVVAYGTSTPELAVTVQSSLTGQADIALGNVVGSSIANVLLILGIAAALVPLVVDQQLVRLDVPIMIAVSCLVLFLSLDGNISRFDGIILSGGAIAYTIFAIGQSRQESPEVQAEYAQEYGGGWFNGFGQIAWHFSLIVMGLVLLVFGSRCLVKGAVAIATLLGVSELIIGLTIVAVGTSLPEIAVSIIASLRGERDIAVGNAVGSNIFNILLVLGLGSILAPSGINVSVYALRFDIPVMIAVATACLPIFFTGYAIDRWEGFLFLGYYAAYILYLLLNATQHDSLEAFSSIMMIYVVPITGVTLIILSIRAISTNQSSDELKGKIKEPRI
jgi:cation:H+ antiporter